MLLVAFLNMVSAMLIILLEKTSMIGLLKALGMRNRAVQHIFMLRSLASYGAVCCGGMRSGRGLRCCSDIPGSYGSTARGICSPGFRFISDGTGGSP